MTQTTTAGIEISALEGGRKTLAQDALQGFRAAFRGPILRAGDAGYDDARLVWNGMIDRRPALIARCTGTADVAAAVNFARSQNLLVAVRGGGTTSRGAHSATTASSSMSRP